MEIEWEEPPEVALARVRTPGRYVEFAYALREHRDKWARLPEGPGEEARSEKGAQNLAQNIRRGTTAGFKPKGSYEAVADEGKVWVRFVGEEAAEGNEEAAEGSPGEAAKRDPAAVRAWARTNGFNVTDRGRIPEDVFDAYARALEKGEVGLSVRLVGRGDSRG